ncbi:MAG: uroporphyrinogen-III synthase [Pseudomonadota bacterium]
MSERPLQGRVVVITRRREDAPALVQSLEAQGARVHCIPMIRFAPPDDTTVLAQARERVADHDLLVLTSKQAVRAFLHALPPPSSALRVVAVGHSTAEAIRDLGWPVHVEGTGEGGEALAQQLVQQGGLDGTRVLYPVSSLARSGLPATLREAGARVDEVVAYQTLPPTLDTCAALWPLLDDTRALFVYASPSAAAHLEQLARDHHSPVPWTAHTCISIGPTTTRALRQLGALQVFEASRPDDEGLLDALARAASAGPPNTEVRT